MIDDLFFIEKSTYKNSPIHLLDVRVKIIIAFALITVTVALPYRTAVYPVTVIFLLFLAFLWVLSKLSPLIYLKRLGMILPFGIFIILFQIFFQNRYYTAFHSVVNLPFGIHIYAESIEFALILFLKFLVCISAIILLSSTSKLQDLLEGASRMGLPPEFALVLGMMIRYLFVFGYMIRKISQTLETKCFDPFDHHLPYKYRIQQIGYTIGTAFIRSYEQGERVYTSMLCRGYGKKSHLFIKKKPLLRTDWSFLIGCISFVILVPIIIYFSGFFH